MIGRRIQPLLLVLVVGAVVLLGRLYWIQVREHDVWSNEAARLVHAGHVLPYRRGRIVDAHGEVLAKDKGTFQLVLLYREFRRGHPLGQVAHARSLLEGRAVSLREAHENLVPWAVDLVSLTSAQLTAFASGEAVETATWSHPGGGDPTREHLGSRASDLRFYVGRLLDLGARQWNEVRSLGKRRATDVSFHVLAAEERSKAGERRWSAEDVLADLESRLAESVDQLARLARLLDRDEDLRAGGSDGRGDPLSNLVAEIEDSRRLVEDATASKLFYEATGFSPGRIDDDTLLTSIDLDWIMHLFAWDRARMAKWAETVRDGWTGSWRDGYALPHLHAELVLHPATCPEPDEVWNRVAAIFAPEGAVESTLNGAPIDWRALDSLAVFGVLDEIFAVDLPRDLRASRRAVLPVQDPARRAASEADLLDWSIFDDAVSELPAEDDAERIALGARLRHHLENRRRSRDVEAVHAILAHVVAEWERAVQDELRATLDTLRETADPDDLSRDGRLILREELRERAMERADHLLKDYGMRPRPLQRRRPDYEVVYLLTRYGEWFPGIEAREVSEREYLVHEGDEGRLAEKLVGSVSAVDVYQLQRQRLDAQRMRSLQKSPRRTTEQEDELRRLVGRVLLPDEVRGVAGIEGFFDPELRGTNGYEERRGLQEAFERGGERQVRVPEDGADLVLTLELDMQRAAERTLAHPSIVDDELFDEEWARNPVGAIVVITPDGDVIAAASEPTEHSTIVPGVVGQRANPIERALRKPGFQPPGSVFKPFVALYALDRGGLDPARESTCGPIASGGCGYENVHCWREWGHGEVALERAIVESCNGYFAWLGESYDDADFLSLGDFFGFGEPTGIRRIPEWDEGVARRLGLREVVPAVFQGDRRGGALSDFQRRTAGNGLVVVEVTPMQLARAYAGLATGVLPDIRIARAVSERELPAGAGERLPFAAESFRFVREALAAVVTRQGGTGRRALSPDQLGFAIAAKTGSADIREAASDSDDDRVRKHTWTAGWVPADDPQLVFVVFVHDTITTSSHGAVYVARSFLQQPEVRAWLEARGVDVGPISEEAPR